MRCGLARMAAVSLCGETRGLALRQRRPAEAGAAAGKPAFCKKLKADSRKKLQISAIKNQRLSAQNNS